MSDQVKVFKSLANSVKIGTPVVEALHIAAEETADEKLKGAVMAMKESILGGRNMADSMKEHGDLFAEKVIATVWKGECEGSLDKMLEKIAAALEADDLDSLLG